MLVNNTIKKTEQTKPFNLIDFFNNFQQVNKNKIKKNTPIIYTSKKK